MSLIPTTAPVDYRRKIAYELMQQGADGAPIQHWAQGLAKLGQGALGGYQMYQADQKDKEAEAEGAKAYLSLLQGGTPNAPQAAPASPMPAPAVPPAQMAKSSPVAAALAGPRPGGPVMPSNKVWGDAEAEAAGLYEKPAAPVQVASLGPVPMPQARPQTAPQPVVEAMAKPPAAPVASPVADDPKAKIVSLLQSENPAARKMGKSLADNYIAAQFKPETTDEIKEYKLAVDQAKAAGEKPPSFVEYKTGLKKAGATNVNVDTKGENAFATKAGQLQAERYDGLASDAQGAKQMISDVQTLKALGDNIKTGKLAEAKAAIGPYADALGIKVDGLSEIQAFEAIVNRVAPSLRVKGSGAQSDFELKNFLKSLPSLGNTAEGNAIATKTMEGLYENKMKAAEIGSRALAREITPAEADRMLRNLPDHMADYREYLKKSGKPEKPSAAPAAPKPGELRDGWRFKGGNPADPKSWEQAS